MCWGRSALRAFWLRNRTLCPRMVLFFLQIITVSVKEKMEDLLLFPEPRWGHVPWRTFRAPVTSTPTPRVVLSHDQCPCHNCELNIFYSMWFFSNTLVLTHWFLKPMLSYFVNFHMFYIKWKIKTSLNISWWKRFFFVIDFYYTDFL